jgi:hypothetical protein
MALFLHAALSQAFQRAAPCAHAVARIVNLRFVTGARFSAAPFALPMANADRAARNPP